MILAWLIHAPTACFPQSKVDTLQLAQELRTQKKLKQASELLAGYHANHPEDINALWLYAQTEFWRNHFRQSKQLYEEAIKLQPEKELLQLDYAKSLFEMGEWEKADTILSYSENAGHYSSDGLLLRSKIFFKQGDFENAKLYSQKALISYSANQPAKDFLTEIKTATAPWIKFNAAFTADDQPAQNIAPSVEAGFLLNKNSSLYFGVYSPFYFFNGRTESTQLFSAGDVSTFRKTGTLLQLDAGVVKFPSSNKIDFTGNIYAQQILKKHLVIDAQAEHKPYLYTISSLDSSISVNHFAASVGWNDQRTVNGAIGMHYFNFPDENYTYSIYGWLYAPPIKFSLAELRFGYGYSFSDSKESRFTNEVPLNQIITDYYSGYTITGIYNPYFTPLQQKINSALASLLIHPSKKVSVGVNANVGVYATAQNPYFYLDKNDAGDTIIASGFSKTNYTPVELSTSVSWKATDKIWVTANYAYRSTFFYNSHYIGAGLKMSLWNEKK